MRIDKKGEPVSAGSRLAEYVPPADPEDEEAWCREEPSMGSYGGFTPYTPSRTEKKALRQRQPIGFIHFPIKRDSKNEEGR